jgi:pimeloyl-ACP methyl ester carboxylesterase
MNYAQEQINAGNEVENWQKIIEWYGQHPTSETVDGPDHPKYVEEAKGYFYKGKPITGSLGIFTSPRSGIAELYNSRYVARHLKGILGGLDLSTQMRAITLPTLILWGKHDGILPVPLAQDYYTKLGTPVTQKSVVILEESAHYPMAEEPAKFADEVIRFVNNYK